MTSKFVATTLTVMLAFTGFTGGSLALAPEAAHAAATPYQKEISEQIFKDINQQRYEHGMDPLVPSAEIDLVAQAWSEQMTVSRSLVHNPDYSKQIPAGWGGAGENIASGHSSDRVVGAWMDSPGHRANILGNFTTIGIGVAHDSRGVPWYTTNFGYYESTKLGKVTSSNVSGITQTEATVTWENPTSTGKLTKMEVLVLGPNQVVAGRFVAQNAGTSVKATGLKAGTTYTYLVNATATSLDGSTRTSSSKPFTFKTVAAPVVQPPVTPPVVNPPVVDPPVVQPPKNNPSIKTAGDILTFDSKGVLWNYGNKAGMKNARTQVGSGWSGMMTIHVVDWNSDGVQDIVAQGKNGKLTVYIGNKSGGFNATEIGSGGWQNMELVTGKWKKTDKYPSVIAKDKAGKLWVYGRSNATKLSARVAIGTGWQAFHLTAVDPDKDGVLDIAAKNTKTNTLTLYKTNGKGGFSSTKQIGVGWKNFKVTGYKDFAGSNTTGIIAKDNTGKLWYYPMNSNGVFSSPTKIGNGGWTPMRVANGDR